MKKLPFDAFISLRETMGVGYYNCHMHTVYM